MFWKNKKIALMIPVFVLLAAGCAQARWDSRQMVSEDRDVSGFREVVVGFSGKVILEQGDTEGVTVEADEDLMKKIVTDVRGRRLVLEMKSEGWGWHFNQRGKIIVTVRFKELNGVTISGSADVTCDRITSDELDLEVSGSGDMTFSQVQCPRLETVIRGSGSVLLNKVEMDHARASISGSGDIELAGKGESLRCGISGSGSIDARALEVEDADIRISGSGGIRVNATENLTGTVSGSGNVWYRGRPLVDVSTPGSGDVRPMK